MLSLSADCLPLSEEDMGMMYSDLLIYRRLWKITMTEAYSMFCKLLFLWKDNCTPCR